MITWVVLSGIAYMLLLFFIANRAEKLKANKWINSPWAHTLGMAVYCTTWTYYGGVGRASTNGLDFLTIYLGPTLMLILCYGFYPVLKKIMRISKVLHLTSIADFISVRFGKNATLGVLVTLCSIFGIIPYIALQLKAVVTSLEVFNHVDLLEHVPPQKDYSFLAIFTTVILAIFSILYGARKLDTAEKHTGLMTAIAFESLFKLLVFIVVGVFVVYGVFDGFADVIAKASEKIDVSALFSIQESSSYTTWFSMLTLSAFAIILLPRQFHISFVENEKVNNMKHSSWSFPLYVLAINFFVLPIAIAGLYFFNDMNISSDNYLLAIPIHLKANVLAVFTWLGGLSAATGMIIIETITLSIMVSNSIVIPLFLSTYRVRVDEPQTNIKRILLIRRLSIVAILFLALCFYILIAHNSSLVAIGLVSFGAVINFAPGLLLGLVNKNINSKGVIVGLILGFVAWFITTIIPLGVSAEIVDKAVLENGIAGVTWLNPYALFGLNGLDPLSHSLFWTLGLNVAATLIVSMFTSKKVQESYFAEMYVNHQRFDSLSNDYAAWKGNAKIKDLYQLLGNFIGHERAQFLIDKYATNNNLITLDENEPVHNKLIAFTERLLGGIIGVSAARILIKRATNEEEIPYKEMYSIIQESQKVIEANKELRKKSVELQKASIALKSANEELNKADIQKNEFLYTVTHEIKTPLTSIIALSEIVNDNPDLPNEQKSMYLESVIAEANRLSHLITQVLKLEKYEAGKQRLNMRSVDLKDLIRTTVQTFEGIVQNKNLQLELQLTDAMMLVSCDAELIQQVLVNLLGNAVKYAKSVIKVHTHYEDEWQVWVSDDGKGIVENEKELIFDKFFQAQNQNLKKPEGSGLGLAISKKILDLHNGRIWADTNSI